MARSLKVAVGEGGAEEGVPDWSSFIDRQERFLRQRDEKFAKLQAEAEKKNAPKMLESSKRLLANKMKRSIMEAAANSPSVGALLSPRYEDPSEREERMPGASCRKRKDPRRFPSQPTREPARKK